GQPEPDEHRPNYGGGHGPAVSGGHDPAHAQPASPVAPGLPTQLPFSAGRWRPLAGISPVRRRREDGASVLVCVANVRTDFGNLVYHHARVCRPEPRSAADECLRRELYRPHPGWPDRVWPDVSFDGPAYRKLPEPIAGGYAARGPIAGGEMSFGFRVP